MTEDNKIVEVEELTTSEPVEVTKKIGEILFEKREELGYSLQDVAENLKMKQHQISAIELDNWDALPGAAVTRGFIRTYAKFLKLDITDFGALMPTGGEQPKESKRKLRRSTPRTAPKAAYFDSQKPIIGRRNSYSKRWIYGILIALFLVVALLVGRHMRWLPDLSSIPLFKKDTMSLSEEVLIAPIDAKEIQEEAEENKQREPQEKVVHKELPAVVPVEVLPAVDPNDVPLLPEPEEALPSDNLLVLKCRERSWYELKRPDGLVIKTGMMQSGEQVSIKMKGSLMLTLGNASGVDVNLRGEPVKMNLSANHKTIKLDLK